MDEIIRTKMSKPASKYFATAFLVWAFIALPVTVLAKESLSHWVDLGYRQDSNDWTIASPSGSPNILSDLTWKDIEIFQLRGRFDMFWKHSLYLRGTLGYGWTVSGKNRDSDYAFDNRQGEFSRSVNDAGSGNTIDGLIGIGRIFRPLENSRNLLIIPMIGYSSHQQQLTMKDGLQVVSGQFQGNTFPPVGTRITDLDSSYTMQWYGVWFGADALFKPTETSEIFVRLEYHNIKYYGEGNWNLSSQWQTPRSFADWADGDGKILRVGWNNTLVNKWVLGLEVDVQQWSTEEGNRKAFFLNNTIAETGFNGASRESFGIFFTVGCRCLEF